MLLAWPQQGLATLKSLTDYQQSSKQVLIYTLFLLIVPFFLQTGCNYFYISLSEWGLLEDVIFLHLLYDTGSCFVL